MFVTGTGGLLDTRAEASWGAGGRAAPGDYLLDIFLFVPL